jgi:hypothetical protein
MVELESLEDQLNGHVATGVVTYTHDVTCGNSIPLFSTFSSHLSEKDLEFIDVLEKNHFLDGQRYGRIVLDLSTTQRTYSRDGELVGTPPTDGLDNPPILGLGGEIRSSCLKPCEDVWEVSKQVQTHTPSQTYVGDFLPLIDFL